jgi:diguanylate cyclase (GGDEF)-like protein
MLSIVFAGLLALAPDAPPEPTLPQTVTEAIERCERTEYAEPLTAMRIAEHGLTLDEPRSPAQRGLLLACQAWSQIQLGQMEQARELTLEIDLLAMEPGEPEDRVGLLVRLASLYYRRGDPITALESMEQALDLVEIHGLTEDLPYVLGNVAIYLTESGQFAQAIEHYERILAMAERQPDGSTPLVPVRYNLARALLFADRAEEAREHLEWLVTAMRVPGMEPRLATALSMLGSAWRQMGDLEQAASYMDQADQLLQQIDSPGELSTLRLDQSRLSLDLGNLTAAERYGREALALARQIDYERNTLHAMEHLVDVLAAREQHAEALALHREFTRGKLDFLERSQRSRLNLLESRLGLQRQALELEELHRNAELQQMRLSDESFRRQVAWAALIAVVVFAVLLALWQRANQQRLLRVSRTDALTGLANRRHITLQMQNQSMPEQAVLMLLDLDHFKQINDRFGHDIGDHVLLKVSALIKRVAESHTALCGRWGGEEFAVFLPAADAENSEQLAAQLLHGIAELSIQDNQGQNVPVTASLGFAPIRGLVRDSGQEIWEAALKCADLLLYRAKHAGRNLGYGAWPTDPNQPVNPLALDSALDSGQLRLLTVPSISSGLGES